MFKFQDENERVFPDANNVVTRGNNLKLNIFKDIKVNKRYISANLYTSFFYQTFITQHTIK